MITGIAEALKRCERLSLYARRLIHAPLQRYCAFLQLGGVAKWEDRGLQNRFLAQVAKVRCQRVARLSAVYLASDPLPEPHYGPVAPDLDQITAIFPVNRRDVLSLTKQLELAVVAPSECRSVACPRDRVGMQQYGEHVVIGDPGIQPSKF